MRALSWELQCLPWRLPHCNVVQSWWSSARPSNKARAEKLDRYDLRRLVKQPREGFTLTNIKMETVAPIPYDVLKEGVVQ